MTITISHKADELTGLYHVTIETRSGRRYVGFYTVEPTLSEVKEDFKDNKSSFNHIN